MHVPFVALCLCLALTLPLTHNGAQLLRQLQLPQSTFVANPLPPLMWNPKT